MDQGRKLTYMRVYSGTVKVGDTVCNPGRNVKEKLARLLKMHSNKRERIEQASAGEIVGVMGLKLTTTGDTLCAEDHPILLEPIRFNEPVITMAIEPKGIQDQDRLMDALDKAFGRGPHVQGSHR
jgi:elongation factor G